MDIWLSTSDILDNLDPEQNSVVSQVIQVVGLLGNSMSPLVIVDNLETSKPEHSGGDNPAACVSENSGVDRCEGKAVSPTASHEVVIPENMSKEPRNPNPGDPTGNAEEEKQVEKEEDEEEGPNDIPVESHEPEANSSQIDIVGPHTSSLLPPPLVTDKLTQSETSEPATELEDKATDATSPSTEEEREEAGTETGFKDREIFLTSLGNDKSNNEQSESFLSRENSATPPTEPGTEPQPQTHAWTFDPGSQAEPSFHPTETPTPEAELLSSSGSEAQAPETPPKQETPAEPSELEIPPDCPLTPALETESVETIQQLAQPAEPEVETSPELEITQLETQPEQDTKPASAAKPEGVPETQTEPETNVEQEQDSAPQKEVTSMQETKQTTEKLTGQSEMGAGLESRDSGPAQSMSSAQPEDDIMEEEEEGALGELQEDGFHNSQCSESSGEMTPCDEKNRSKVSKYKTVSYRKIRKGNTKQRIDEFESMINT